MNNRQKSFQQKVNNRKFALENSWMQKTDPINATEPLPEAESNDQMGQILASLEENLKEADLCKVNTGYVLIYPRPTLWGRVVFFAKRVIRKLINIFLGWYLTPLYQRQNQFNGKIINAASLERELLLKLESRIVELEQANMQLSVALAERNKQDDIVNQQNQKDIHYATTTAFNVSTQFAADMQNINATFTDVDKQLSNLVSRTEDQNAQLDLLNAQLTNESEKHCVELEQLHAQLTDFINEQNTQLGLLNAQLAGESEKRSVELEQLHIQLASRVSEQNVRLELLGTKLESEAKERNSKLELLDTKLQSEAKERNSKLELLDTKLESETKERNFKLEQIGTKLNEETKEQNTKLEQLNTKLERETKERNSMLRQLDAQLAAETEDRNTKLELLTTTLIEATAPISDLRNKLEKVENLPTSDDEFYHHFEERFRGSREDIKCRLQVYVPIIRERLSDWSHARFIDIGSGRGEWLDILSENGATDYVGVDLNATQNAIAESFGHNTICRDCIEYLAEQPDNSIDLITGIQIIEHLCMSDLMELLKQSHRVLKKGGMVLFETQNPRNIMVGADTFYIDPSHKRPLEPRTTQFFAEWAGFNTARIVDANSNPQCIGLPLPAENTDHYELIKQFNDLKWLMYGPMDYALFAVKE